MMVFGFERTGVRAGCAGVCIERVSPFSVGVLMHNLYCTVEAVGWWCAAFPGPPLGTILFAPNIF